jgi:2-(1,2-epoxy-1,2-dihydrophenyl)acetyl-CoA isomerase
MTGATAVRPLVERLYAALAAGDEAALRELLADDFHQTLSAGMPLGLGGVRVGPDAAIRDGWWAIGAAFRVLAEPEQWLVAGADRLVVTGTYRGTARATRLPVEARFAHVWTAAGGRLTCLEQITDTVRWADSTKLPSGGPVQ